MTELEQARAHLRRCQDRFHHRRALGVGDVVREEAEAAVLAALSWVWDAQEREKHIRLISEDSILIKAGMTIHPLCAGTLKRGMTIIWPDGSKGRIIA